MDTLLHFVQQGVHATSIAGLFSRSRPDRFLHEASSRLHISTSAISRQIAKLEESLGIVLFERRPRGMVLTAAGELLLQRTQRLAIGMEEALSELRALAGKSHGLIRIASYEGFALDCLTPAIEAFREQHPAVHFHVWVGTSPDICARIKNGSADIGITYSYPPPPILPFSTSPCDPSLPRCAAIIPAGRRSVTLDDLRGEQWAVPDEDRTQRLLLQAALAAKELPSTLSSRPIRWRCCVPIVFLRAQLRSPVPLTGPRQ